LIGEKAREDVGRLAGGNGTMMRTGLVGYCCAQAIEPMTDKATARTKREIRIEYSSSARKWLVHHTKP
jgi:hypothetical protein